MTNTCDNIAAEADANSVASKASAQEPSTLPPPTPTDHTHGAPTPGEPHTRKPGAQPRNQLAAKSGLRSSRLPPGCKAIELGLQALRRAVGHELAQTHGTSQVPLFALAVAQTVQRHEQRAQLAQRWLRLAPDDLPVETKLQLLKAVSDASDARDKCLARLGLDKQLTAGGTLQDLYASLRQPAAIEGEVVTKEEPDAV